MTNPEAELYRLQTLRAAGQLTDAQYQAAVALVQRGKLGEAASPGQGVKLFTPRAIWGWTAIGGIPGGCFMISINLHRLGKKKDAAIWGVMGVLVPTVVLFAASQIPALDRVHTVFWNAMWVCMAVVAYRTLLADDLGGQPAAPNRPESAWKGLFYAIGGLFVLAALVTLIVMVSK